MVFPGQQEDGEAAEPEEPEETEEPEEPADAGEPVETGEPEDSEEPDEEEPSEPEEPEEAAHFESGYILIKNKTIAYTDIYQTAEKGTFIVSPRKRTRAAVSTPLAPAKICSVTFGPSSLMTCASEVPARDSISAISLYFTPSARSVATEPDSASILW